MNNLIKHIQSMYDEHLYSSVTRLCNLALSALEQKSDSLSSLDRLQVTMLHGDSLFETQQYAQAEQQYRQAIQMKKFILKSRIAETQTEPITESEIKHKIAKCLIELKQSNDAILILQTILHRNRTVKINMTLGDLYREASKDRFAVNCYKEVLKEAPLALDAIEHLLRFGVKGVEINSLIIEYTSDISWINMWLKAQAQVNQRDFNSAIESFKSLDRHSLLKDNTCLLVNMGYCYHYMCESEKAISILKRALKQDANLTFGRDLLSTLCAAAETDEHTAYLETICPTGDEGPLWAAEHWTTLGNYMYATKSYEKARSFAQQALLGGARNVEALLLSARVAVKLKDFFQAAKYGKEALLLCPHRFDLYQCQVDVFLKLKQYRDAEAAAQAACAELDNSAHALTLHATALLRDPTASNKSVKRLLERAVGQEGGGATRAVCMLVALFEKEKQYEKAEKLLVKSVEERPSSKLHQMLAECYVNMSKEEEAFHHYNVALKLDPNNKRAMEGLSFVGCNATPTSKGGAGSSNSYTSQGTNSPVDYGDVCGVIDLEVWPNTNSL